MALINCGPKVKIRLKVRRSTAMVSALEETLSAGDSPYKFEHGFPAAGSAEEQNAR
jgi:hypothetical protein